MKKVKIYNRVIIIIKLIIINNNNLNNVNQQSSFRYICMKQNRSNEISIIHLCHLYNISIKK